MSWRQRPCPRSAGQRVARCRHDGFEVNGQALPAVAGPPFTALFDVPSAATTPTLTIVAIGRNAAGAEVARDEVTVNVVVGLKVRPTLLGIPRAGQRGCGSGCRARLAWICRLR